MQTTDIGKKVVVLGISGGIAAYKSCELTRLLIKAGFDVRCVPTHAATHFVTPLTLETLSKNPVHTDIFESRRDSAVNHIALAEVADIVAVVPATADIIAKAAAGICDELLTAILCATRAPVLMSPSMNTNMWENKITQDNISKLKKYGYRFVEPDKGDLACGDTGKGRLPPLKNILEAIDESLKKV